MGRKQSPPLNPEAHQNKLIALALDQAEEALKNKTASSQVLTHFLKLADTKAKLDLEKTKLENRLLEEKIRGEQERQSWDAMLTAVLDALKSYSVSYE